MINRPDTRSQRIKRHKRVRAKISGTPERPRLNVFRSATNIYAQIIDDVTGKTLVSASSWRRISPVRAPSPTPPSRLASTWLSVPRQGIDTVVFDRGGYVYHGRVKALAEGAREGGLQF